MLKKRIIFTLLFIDGFFYQSRNFNLQKVGDLKWLKRNYNFKNISFFIDELIILNISRNEKNFDNFIKAVQDVTEFSFVPVTVGGGIISKKIASDLLSNGADKILINSAAHNEPQIIDEIASTYGEQSIIIGIDLKKENQNYFIYIDNGSKKISLSLTEYLSKINKLKFGEVLINSIDRDGTGIGLDFEPLNLIPNNFQKPIILSGGCGNAEHIDVGIKKNSISAISTANLLNFIGNGLQKCREQLIVKKNNFPLWDLQVIKDLQGYFKKNNRL